MTANHTQQEQPPLCPRCKHNPKPRREELCSNCRADEIADAAGQLPLGASTAPETAKQEVGNFAPAPAGSLATPPIPVTVGATRGTDEGKVTHIGTPAPAQNGAQAKPAAAPPPSSQPPAAPPRSMPAAGAPPAQGRRMALGNVQAKATETRHKVAIFGPEGTGKTTFGQESPAPIFLAPEVSGTLLKSTTPRFPQPQSWRDLVDAVDELAQAQHPYKTLVVDTLDRVQDLAIAEVIREYNLHVRENQRARNIEEVGGGFQKGYVAALDKIRALLARIEVLIERRDMNVILISHGQVRKISDPSVSDAYEQWDLSLIETNQAPIAGTIRNWVDALLFVNFQTQIKKDRRGRPTKRAESPADGNRRLYTQRTPGWRAKNRDGLPLELPFSWEHYAHAVASSEDPAYLRQVIADKVAELGEPAITEWVDREIKKNPERQRLTQINLKLSARLEQRADQEEAAQAAGDGA